MLERSAQKQMNMIGQMQSADQLATTNQIAASHKKLSHGRTKA